MFHDLNVPWTPFNEVNLRQTLAFLDEVGYDVVALSFTLSGKLPSDLSCPIPSELHFPTPTKLRILRRCTLIFSDPSQNHRLAQLASNYDIIALRPTTEKALQLACQAPDADIISLDLTVRPDYHFKMKMLSTAIENGIKFEICYAPAVAATDANARRNVIMNATQLIRATRGRGLILSSEASQAAACRAPADLVNLAAVWGLGQEKGTEALGKLARSVVVTSQLKRSGYRGVVDIVQGGNSPQTSGENIGNDNSIQHKRKVEVTDSGKKTGMLEKKAMSKRERKRQRLATSEVQNTMENESSTSKNESSELVP